MKREYKVGWKRLTSCGATLEIVRENEDNLFIVCSRCHSDFELFPYPIVKPKTHIRKLKSKDPCGCVRSYAWSEAQRVIQIQRVCKNLGYIFHGFVGKFSGNKTYLDLENPETGNRWGSCNIANFLNNGRGDPIIGRQITTKARAISIEDRLQHVEEILKEEGIPQEITINTISKRGRSYTSFDWVCAQGHKRVSTFNNFINHNQRCGDCHHIDNNFSGFVGGVYTGRLDDNDFIYILGLENNEESFIKIGRSFNVDRRLIDIKTSAKSYKVSLLYLEKGNHSEIVERESYLLNKTKHLHHMPTNKFDGWSECRVNVLLEEIVTG
ncbi:TPA: GIY-YIG nuclease family protein [Vibrio cholerae]|nr:GIY-YIG nuclease family protein [Vibrio cholerae]